MDIICIHDVSDEGASLYLVEHLIRGAGAEVEGDALLFYTRLPDKTITLANRNLHWVGSRSPVTAQAAAVGLACSIDADHELISTVGRLKHRLPYLTRLIISSPEPIELPDNMVTLRLEIK